MVDFQSRDSSRGLDSDDDDDEDGDPGGDEAATEVDETAAETDETTTDAVESPVESSSGDADSLEFEHDESVTADATTAADDQTDHGEAADSDAHSAAHDNHDHAAHDHAVEGSLGVAVVTISSTRTIEDDPSGDVIEELVGGAGHEVATRDLVRDDLDGIQNAVTALVERNDVDALVTTGGTGITPDDVTVEAVEPLLDKELPGFGELFRLLSHEDVGTRAIASRATAGVIDGVVVFCLPGSEPAARLGTDELITEELTHLVGLARGEH